MTELGNGFLTRTLASLSRRQLITPHFEKALLLADWPEEYAIKVYNKERRWDGYFHPSSDAAEDPLRLYYKFHPDFEMKRDRPTPSLEMTFQVGNTYHSLLQSMFLHLGFTNEDEVEVSFVSEKRHCSGTLDIRKFFLPDGRAVPIELKSCHMIPKEPYPKHVLQTQLYMDLGCEQPQELGVIFYLEKVSPHRTAEFVIHRDEAVLDEIYGRWDSVLEAIAFNDPSVFRNCCMANTKAHRECPAREVCRIGSPTPSGVSR